MWGEPKPNEQLLHRQPQEPYFAESVMGFCNMLINPFVSSTTGIPTVTNALSKALQDRGHKVVPYAR